MTGAGAHFQESRQELARAGALLADLEKAIARFFASRPFAMQISTDPATGEDLYRMRLTRRLPRRFATLTRRAANAQVAALDELVRAMAARHHGDTQRRPASLRFPFCQSAGAMDDAIRRCCGAVATRDAALLKAAAPYPEGNAALFALTRIRKPRWARLLKPGAQAKAIVVRDGSCIAGPAFLSSPTWNERRREVVMRGMDPDSQLAGQARVEFFVAFRCLEVPRYRSVPSLLAAQIRIIADLIEAAESLDAPQLPTVRRGTRAAMAVTTS